MSSAHPTTAPQPGTILRLTPLAKILVGYLLLEIALWSPKHIQIWFSLLLAGWVIGTTVLSRYSAEQLGLTRRGFRESSWVPLAALAVGGIFLFCGWLAGSLHPLFGPIPASTHAVAYAVWAFQQEFMLQSFFFLGLLQLTSPRRAVIIAAVLFSFAHLPNPILVIATLLSGIALTAAFARYRNVYSVAIAHAILGLAVAISIPADLHRNMRVGLGYLTYHPMHAANSKPMPTGAPSSRIVPSEAQRSRAIQQPSSPSHGSQN